MDPLDCPYEVQCISCGMEEQLLGVPDNLPHYCMYCTGPRRIELMIKEHPSLYYLVPLCFFTMIVFCLYLLARVFEYA